MQLRVLLEIAWKRVWKKRWIAALCVLLTAGAFGLMVTGVALGRVSGNARREISGTLSDPLEQYGEIDVDWWANDEFSYEDAQTLFSDIAGLPSIKSLGSSGDYFTWGLNDVSGRPDTFMAIRKEQLLHPLVFSETDQSINTDDMEDVVQMKYMAMPLWPAFDLPLLEGTEPSDSSENLIYVGYNFRNCVEVGTVLCEGEEKYRIAGVLEKGAAIPDREILFFNNSMSTGGLSSFVLHTVTPLDNLVLLVGNGITPDQKQFISWEKGYTIEEVEAQIREVTDPYHIPISVSSFQQKIDDDLLTNDMFSNIFFEISLIISISAAILIFCTQMLSVLQKKNDLGIFLSQGISRKGLYIILFLENLIQIVPAAMLAPFVIKNMLLRLDMGEAIIRSFWKLVYGPVGVGLIFAIFLMTALSTGLVLLLLKSSSSATLLKGEIKQSSRVFAVLFLTSFTVSIGLIWYGTTLKARIERVTQTQSSVNYQFLDAHLYQPQPTLSELEEIRNEADKDANIVLKIEIPVKRAAFGNEVNILLEENQLDYPLSSGVYPSTKRESGLPSCVIGEGLLEKTVIEEGVRYLELGGTYYEVTGILECNHFAGIDNRIWTFGETIPEDLLERYLNNSNLYVSLFKNGEFSSDEAERFVSDMEERFGESLESIDAWNEWDQYSGDDSEGIATLYLTVCSLLTAISVVSLVMLSLLWATRRQLRHMIMHVNGYSRLRVLTKDMANVFLYECIAGLLVLTVSFAIDLLKGNPAEFRETLGNGGAFALLLAIGIGLISLVPVSIRLLAEKPSIVLKHTE